MERDRGATKPGARVAARRCRSHLVRRAFDCRQPLPPPVLCAPLWIEGSDHRSHQPGGAYGELHRRETCRYLSIIGRHANILSAASQLIRRKGYRTARRDIGLARCRRNKRRVCTATHARMRAIQRGLMLRIMPAGLRGKRDAGIEAVGMESPKFAQRLMTPTAEIAVGSRREPAERWVFCCLARRESPARATH